MPKIPRVLAGAISLAMPMLFFCACARTNATIGPDSTQSSVGPNGELRYKAPEGWVTEKPSSSMRVAQYRLPKTEGDPEDASLVLYFFGPGQGGSVSDNIDRWVGQMQQPDGSSSKDKARSEIVTVNGLKITMLDVSGTYIAQMSPGSDTHTNNSHYRLRAAVIETPKGNYFAKLIGPEKTIGRWDQSFGDYVKSFAFK